jgi:hypothetical protein
MQGPYAGHRPQHRPVSAEYSNPPYVKCCYNNTLTYAVWCIQQEMIHVHKHAVRQVASLPSSRAVHHAPLSSARMQRQLATNNELWLTIYITAHPLTHTYHKLAA